MMPEEQHLGAVRTFYEQLWNAHDLSCLPSLVQPDVRFRGSLGDERRGLGGLADYVDEVHEAFGDYRCELEDLLADGRSAAARLTFSGLHRGTVLGVAPTGRPVTWSGAAFFKFSPEQSAARVTESDTEVRISEIWVLGDVHALRTQLRGNHFASRDT